MGSDINGKNYYAFKNNVQNISYKLQYHKLYITNIL